MVMFLMRALKGVKEFSLSFWDAMIWSAAKEADCTLLLSEDFQDNRKLDGVFIQNPFSTSFEKEGKFEDLFDLAH